MPRVKPTLTDDLLTIFDVAAFIGRSVSTVYDWTDRGLLPTPVEFGGRYRWRRSDLLEWAEAGYPKRDAAKKKTKAKA
jgi:excisionase family DNA binding protein